MRSPLVAEERGDLRVGLDDDIAPSTARTPFGPAARPPPLLVESGHTGSPITGANPDLGLVDEHGPPGA